MFLKLNLFYVIVITYSFVYAEECKKSYPIQENQEKLDKVMTFVENRYYDFNFDGLLGIVLAQVQLLKIHQLHVTMNIKKDVDWLIERCQSIRRRILPLLPQDPLYMITFKKKLLNPLNWTKLIHNSFETNKILHLPFHENWTAKNILNNRAAVYKGVKTDVCLQEILILSKENFPCYISPLCQEMMFDKHRIDSGYLLTHRLLYMLIVKLQECRIQDTIEADIYMRYFCSLIYRESKTEEHLDYPYHDIFLEQVLLCGMLGIEEFLHDKWFYKIIDWQKPHGCFKSINTTITKRTSNTIDFGCSDHATGLGAASLALYLRYFLTKSSFNDTYLCN